MKRIKSFPIFIFLIVFSCSDQSSAPQNQLNYSWEESSAKEQNIDSLLLENAFCIAGENPSIYSMVVIRNGYLVGERYYQGYDKNSTFNIRSVSKSYLSAMTGVALQEKILDSLDQKMLSFYPEYVHAGLDARKQDITLEHLLQMKGGIDNDHNLYTTIYESNNWLKTTIELPLINNPGESFSYNTFLTHLLSGILTKASGTSTLTFARKYLTDPMGVSIDQWEKGPQKIYFGGNSMYFTTRDMAVLGFIYLNNGQLDGKQIVSAEWVEMSLKNHRIPRISRWGNLKNIGYGYLWWLGEIGESEVFLAIGHGGQFIICFPELNLIVATNSDADLWGWDKADENERAVLDIVANYVLPAVL